MTPEKFTRLVASARKAGIVTISQLACIIHLYSHGTVTYITLCAHCRISRTGAAHMTRHLADLEFIAVSTHTPGSHAPRQISLTPLGRAWLESVGISAA